MAKRKKEKPIERILWLLVSVAGGVLFSFGLLGYIESKGWSPMVSVISGIILVSVALLLGKFRTETSVAQKTKIK